MRFLDAFAAALPDDTLVVGDMCIAGYWLGGFTPRRPAQALLPDGLGHAGLRLPARGRGGAGGAAPVCVCGDGGFLYGCGELATVAQERIPLTDGDRGRQRLRDAPLRPAPAGDPLLGVDLVRPDFASLAGSFGIEPRRSRAWATTSQRHSPGTWSRRAPVLVARAAIGAAPEHLAPLVPNDAVVPVRV